MKLKRKTTRVVEEKRMTIIRKEKDGYKYK